MFNFKTFALFFSVFFATKSQAEETNAVKWNLLEMEMGMDMSAMEDMEPAEVVHMMMEDHPLPEANVTYTMNNGDHLCLNENITYMSIDWDYVGCNVEFDMNGTSILSSSYVEIINENDLLSKLYVDQILMQHVYMMDYMDWKVHNCTMTPVIKIVDIVYFDELNIIRLYFIEPQLTEYINLLNTNQTRKNLYDLNDVTYMEPMDKLKKGLIANNVTNSTVILNKFACYEYDEEGNIIGEVDSSVCESENDIITEMGSKYGSSGFIDKNSTDVVRRRLIFGWIKQAARSVVNFVKETVEKIVDFVETVIDIIKGDVDERFTLGRLQISASSGFEVSGELEERETKNGKGTLNGNGNFRVEAGANLDLHAYIDFEAQYQLFSLDPSFDSMRVAIVTELLLDAYLNLDISGELDLQYEIFKLGKRKVFFVGPIPVVVNLFAELNALLNINFDVSLSLNAGIEPIFYEFGAEYIKGNGWRRIENSNLNLIPYYNIGSALDNNEGVVSDSCFSASFVPGLELKLGITLYEVLTIYNSYTFENDISLSYPYNCNSDDKCSGDPSLGFAMDTYLTIALGIELGNDKIGLELFSGEFEIATIDLNEFESCIKTFLAPLYYSCCGEPETKFPTLSPTVRPTFNPTKSPVPAPTSKPTQPYGLVPMSCYADSSYTGYDATWTKGCYSSSSCHLFGGMLSHHDNGKEDRQFRFRYCKPTGSYAHLLTTYSFSDIGTTSYDAEWWKYCPSNAAVTRIYSVHDNGKEDRTFTIRCAKFQNTYFGNCRWTGWVNSYDGGVNYNCPNNGVINAIHSRHDNGKEDRQWDFRCCNVYYSL